jgi:hypothetical protein
VNKKVVLSGIIVSLLIVSLVVYSLPAFAQGSNTNSGKHEVISASGKIPGKDLIVHVWAIVPPGEDRNAVAVAALAHQGARPLTSNEYTTIALHWDQFSDSNALNDFVIQFYNSANVPVTVGANGLIALQHTQKSWTDVTTSKYTINDGGSTGRCPSLVKECGSQTFDGFNDVGWLPLSSATTLGVTWTGTSIDEADMALNTNFNWSTTGGNYDVETVFLHENGHVAGLGHSTDINAIMYPSYQKVNRVLQTDDINGISFLYPTTTNNPPPTLVTVDKINYLKNGKNLNITVHVKAVDSGNSISGSSVNIQLKRDNTNYGNPATSTTDTNGNAKFVLRNIQSGTYTTVVQTVSGSNILWDTHYPVNLYTK